MRVLVIGSTTACRYSRVSRPDANRILESRWRQATVRPNAATSCASGALESRPTTTVVGWVNKLIALSTRFAPRWLSAVIFGRVVKLMHSQAPQQSGSHVESPALSSAARK